MIKKLLSRSNNSIIEVMMIINENGMGISFVIDDDQKLIGLVTDGDIRQAIIKRVELDTKITEVMNTKFIYGNIDESYASLMTKISDFIHIIPLVNDNNEVVDYFEFKQNMYFPVAIPNLNGNEFHYLVDAFMSTWISSSGEYILRFEKEFSKYCDCSYGVSCTNGTIALHLALIALGIGSGDEVIIPDLTFAATINAVIHAGATPVIVDVEEDSWCIDPKKIEEAITEKTKAVIPVHLYGQACDMDAITALAKQYNLSVIEDCAEAHGAMYKGKKVGSFGDIGCFSFYGNKVITTGEGGMCTTNNLLLDEKMRLLRDHGMSKTKRYWHDVIGYNYRTTNLQAAIGLAQLERIDEIHKNRKMYEDKYRKILDPDMFTFQKNLQNREKITWLVSVLLREDIERDGYISKLKEKGIDARPFFYPLSDMDIYKLYCKTYTPVTHKISKIGLNLPTYESLKNLDEIGAILQNGRA